MVAPNPNSRALPFPHTRLNTATSRDYEPDEVVVAAETLLLLRSHSFGIGSRDSSLPPATRKPKIKSNECGNVFPSHEASSSNKTVYKIKPVIDEKTCSHPCSMCNATFPTGQALGGHMTVHRIKSQVVSTPASASHEPSGKLPATGRKRKAKSNECGNVSPSHEATNNHKTVYEIKPVIAEEIGSHSCLICKATFQMGQALGGHMTAHRIKRRVVSTPASSTREPSENLRKRPICDEIFPTPEALGGHMSKHFKGSINEKSTSNVKPTDGLNLNLSLAPPRDQI